MTLQNPTPTKGLRYGLIICDPPAFAKSRKAVDGAYRGYKELNLRCMKMAEPGGILVTCSCSQFMTPELFFKMLREAAFDAGRDVRLLETLMQCARPSGLPPRRSGPSPQGLYPPDLLIIPPQRRRGGWVAPPPYSIASMLNAHQKIAPRCGAILL